jgi:N-acetylneuraminic acid mutarotase
MKRFLYVFIILVPCGVFAQGVWVNDSLPGFDMTYVQSHVIDGKIFVVDLVSDSNRISIFDPVLHKWSFPETGISTPRRAFASCLLGGKLYTFGAESDSVANKVDVFDPVTNLWSNIPYTGTFTSRSGFTASEVNGKIYTIGGEKKGTLSTLEVFDPITATWSTPETRGAFIARSSHTASVVGGKIYVLGGDITGVNGKIQIFDPETKSWSTPTTSGVFTPRVSLTSSVLNGKIYAIGGYNFATKINVLEVFDPVVNAWSTPSTTGKFTARTNMTSSVVDNKIYVIGGYEFFNNQGSTFFFPGNHNEVLTPSSENVRYEFFKNITIYPNPTTSIITTNGVTENIMNLSISNTLGEKVMDLKNPHNQDFTLDLSKLVPGTYYIRFSSANAVATKKILVKE